MAKRKSRATRLSDALSNLTSVKEALEGYLESMEDDEDGNKIKESASESFPDSCISIEDDKAEIEALKEEIESWYDNMTGTNLENTEKYSLLEECKDNLESIIDSFPSDDISAESSVDDIQSFIDELDSAISEGDSVEFPGMF